MSNVVGLGGVPVVLPGEPDKNIVALLESLLADAKSGNIVALGVASVDQNGWCRANYALNTRSYTLAGAISSLQYRLQRDIEDSHDD